MIRRLYDALEVCRQAPPGRPYREAAEAVARLEEQFPEEYAGLLEALLDACARREDLMLEHAFRVGFSTAVRLLVETLPEPESTQR